MLKVNGDKGEWVATAQKPCYGSAAASSSYARRDLRYAFTELLRGVDMCLTLDQFGELITCPIQEGDGARSRPSRRHRHSAHHPSRSASRLRHRVAWSLKVGRL
jgi:hypothetical protein